MARFEVNRTAEMDVFVRVVDQGGFSAAARELRLTPSAVSKLMSRLEQRLGARLLNRSTRRLQLTPEGTAFYERSVRLLADLDEAERSVAASEEPRGRLRVNANVPFGHHFLAPALADFLTRYPGISLDMVLTDKVVDLMEERMDVAVRAGPLKDSQLVARKLGETRQVIVASPAYLARMGMPQRPADLEAHNRIGFCYLRQIEGWPLRGEREGETLTVRPEGNAMASDGEGLRHLVLGGVGMARFGMFHVAHDIAAGRLVPVLEAFNPGDLDPLHAVYLGQGGNMPARVRVYLDFLVEVVAPRFIAAAMADARELMAGKGHALLPKSNMSPLPLAGEG
ncbi:transcriptional regulator [Azorhizobium oxalatiphilum]|uniref:Transcriptional regulator n=1 Tax=Azorhizobium oxalatiphilum TaxID=980631 RepID=A0A917C0L2_9HYPH|nr:LysR family transcriptional regulator [Azorhizobium oxalatiphilum]GGF64109.1 transcriptional regulator [Azorhizobium oxalatiphilum]